MPKLQLSLFVIYIFLFLIDVACEEIPKLKYFLRLMGIFLIILYGFKHYIILFKHRNHFFFPIFYGKDANEEASQFLIIVFIIFSTVILLFGLCFSINFFVICVISLFCFIIWFICSLSIFCFDEKIKEARNRELIRNREAKQLNNKTLFLLLKKGVKPKFITKKKRVRSKYGRKLQR